MNCLKAWQHYLGSHETKVFTNNVFFRYFETQPRAMAKEFHWHDTLALMDIKLTHKPRKNNVVPYVLSRKEEYQRQMHWERYSNSPNLCWGNGVHPNHKIE